MKTKRRKPAATAEEKRHMTRVAELGCIVCRNLGFGFSQAELHHPRSLAGAGQKASNMDVIGLCPQHHRLGTYGVAYHAGPEAWELNFGTEIQLLEQQRKELGMSTKHTVKPGDTLWSIAGQHYQDHSLWPVIASANSGIIKNPDLIQPGWVLVIPAKPNEQAAKTPA